jgi:hypothetical protein
MPNIGKMQIVCPSWNELLIVVNLHYYLCIMFNLPKTHCKMQVKKLKFQFLIPKLYWTHKLIIGVT